MYDSGTVGRSGSSAGTGQIYCPRCNGSGKIQGYVGDDVQSQNAISDASEPFTMYPLPIFIFAVFCTWGAIQINSYYHIAHKYEVGLIAFVVALIFGVFIRKILLMLFSGMIVLGMITVLGLVGIYIFTH